MDIPWLQILKNMLYFLAVLNPASKILFLTAYEPPLSFRQTLELSWKSSLTALLILVTFALLGQVVLQEVFRIEMYSLRVAGGLILFFTGWLAVREGRFFHQADGNVRVDFTELSIIPLAAPLISGPGTITIALSLAAEHGYGHCITVVTLAILINFCLMVCALPINRGLLKLHLAGPVIRITGLVVATVAIQMILSGVGEWLLTLQSTQLPAR